MSAAREPEYRDGHGFIAEVIRTRRRKSADIRVEEGAVSVVVPLDTPVEKIDQLLASKRSWISRLTTLRCRSTRRRNQLSSMFIFQIFEFFFKWFDFIIVFR